MARGARRIREQRQATNSEQGKLKSDHSTGVKAVVRDLVQNKEASSTRCPGGHRPKLTHDYFTGPWEVVSVIGGHLRYVVQLNSGRVRQLRAAASDVKPLPERIS